MNNRPQDVPQDATSGSGNDPADVGPRIAIRVSGKPMGYLLVGNRSGLLDLAARLQRIATAPPGADPGRFPLMPYHDELEVLRCRKNLQGRAGGLLGVLVDEAIDEPEEEVVEPVRHSVLVRALIALFWISFLLVFLLGAKEVIRLLVSAVAHFLQ